MAAAALAALLVLGGRRRRPTGTGVAAADGPNVVVVMTDDQTVSPSGHAADGAACWDEAHLRPHYATFPLAAPRPTT